MKYRRIGQDVYKIAIFRNPVTLIENYTDMKIFLVAVLYFVWIMSLLGQTIPARQKGNYFKITSNDYVEKVIKPWKYQYTQTQAENLSDERLGYNYEAVYY